MAPRDTGLDIKPISTHELHAYCCRKIPSVRVFYAEKFPFEYADGLLFEEKTGYYASFPHGERCRLQKGYIIGIENSDNPVDYSLRRVKLNMGAH